MKIENELREDSDHKANRNQPMEPDASWIEVGPKDAQSSLVIYPKLMMPNWEELKPSIVFRSEDIQSTFETMSSKGVKFTENPNTMSWGTYAIFEDPDGNEFLIKG